jgi:hypothetical protein
MGGEYAYNWRTGERMLKPERPRLGMEGHISEWQAAYYYYCSQMKIYDAFVEECPPFPHWQRPKLKHATEKGIPVPRTGARRWHSGKSSGKTGVIGSSRMLPHRYMDEGDKGAIHNRHIKRVERAQWLSEWQEDSNSEEAYDTAEWFESVYVWWEVDDYDESPYDDWCETCNGPCEL